MINNIQVIRAVAALLIVLQHSMTPAIADGNALHLLSVFLNWAACGVDLFFVISGFIIVFIQSQKKYTPCVFLMRRMIRLIPLYWLATITYFVLYLLIPSAFVGKNIDMSWLIISMIMFSQQILNKFPVIYFGWTIEYEFVFYIIFAISIHFRHLPITVFASFLLVATWSVFGATPRVYEFTYGLMIGLIYAYFPRQILLTKIPLLLLVFGLILLISTIFIDVNHYGGTYICYGIPAALITSDSVYSLQIRDGFIVRVGNASYSIYLIQQFSIPCFFMILKTYWGETYNADAASIISFLLTLSAGIVCYRLVEKRLTRYFDRLIFPH